MKLIDSMQLSTWFGDSLHNLILSVEACRKPSTLSATKMLHFQPEEDEDLIQLASQCKC